MLIDITIKNFRSIKEEAVLSMETGARLTKFKKSNTFQRKSKNVPALVKSAFIFGPNANGKTNVLRAFELLSFLLKVPTQDVDDQLVTDRFVGNEKNTSFLVNFTKNEIAFKYYLEYNGNEVVEEYLDMNGKKVLDRKYQDFKELPEMLKSFVGTFRKNQLLLYLAQNYNYEIAQQAFTWFTQDVVFIRNGSNRLGNSVLKKVKDSQELRVRLLNFMQAADFGIEDFEIVENTIDSPFQTKIDEESQEIRFVKGSESRTRLELYFRHQTKDGTILLPFTSESEGTRVFVSLAIQLLVNRGTGKLLLIDEFEKSLHSELSQALMKIFNHEQQRNQFILTTHDLELMDEKLRVDQIWFVEKSEFGESVLYNLFDFDLSEIKRGDYSFKKRYVMGRFGATQIINQNRLLQNVFDDAAIDENGTSSFDEQRGHGSNE